MKTTRYPFISTFCFFGLTACFSRQPVEGIEGLQTNNPGWPGFESMGWISGGSIYAAVSW